MHHGTTWTDGVHHIIPKLLPLDLINEYIYLSQTPVATSVGIVIWLFSFTLVFTVAEAARAAFCRENRRTKAFKNYGKRPSSHGWMKKHQ